MYQVHGMDHGLRVVLTFKFSKLLKVFIIFTTEQQGQSRLVCCYFKVSCLLMLTQSSGNIFKLILQCLPHAPHVFDQGVVKYDSLYCVCSTSRA